MTEDAITLADLTQRLLAFRDARDWRQFHSLKDLVVSLNLEAAELLELTQWTSEEEFEIRSEAGECRSRIAEECADVLIYLLLIGERTGIDLQRAVAAKIVANEARYPVEKSRGNARKYVDL